MKNIKIEGLDENDLSKYSIKQLSMIEGGIIGGNTNKESGHISNLGKKWGKINANHPNSIAASKISGQKNVEKRFWENLTFEQRSIGGKKGGKKRTEMEDWKDMPSIAGKKSAINRINKKIEKYKEILSLIPTDEFTTSDAKLACEQFGYNDWKKFLKEDSLIQQIYKGFNQFNPSKYKKINP